MADTAACVPTPAQAGEVRVSPNPSPAANAHSLPEPPAVDLGEGGTARGGLAGLWVPLELRDRWLF